MKTYVITVSQTFPKTHLKSGQETGFIDKIANKHKITTIRSNYALWKKRFEEIEKGKACLSVRVWEGSRYIKGSKQREIFVFYKSDEIGLQKLEFHEDKDGVCALKYPIINNHQEPEIKIIAKNDGLSYCDFKDWFKRYDLSEPIAIIHFTNFRY